MIDVWLKNDFLLSMLFYKNSSVAIRFDTKLKNLCKHYLLDWYKMSANAGRYERIFIKRTNIAVEVGSIMLLVH